VLGMKVETFGNVGAYLSNLASGGPTINTANFGTGNYYIENYEAISKAIVTNTVPVDAYRGYCRPEGAYIAERTIEAVARHLKLDPVEARGLNFVRLADFPYRPSDSNGVMSHSCNYPGRLHKALHQLHYS